MTLYELREEAQKQGYKLIKTPSYQCTCYMDYPNECYRKKNGSWKCVDKYEPIKWKNKGDHFPTTHCRRKGSA